MDELRKRAADYDREARLMAQHGDREFAAGARAAAEKARAELAVLERRARRDAVARATTTPPGRYPLAA